eukprot:m.55296 g.55296  ORF g.55296 m.55296 type:complete len:369 (-) comp11473_c0_seq3:2242-3348(-)
MALTTLQYYEPYVSVATTQTGGVSITLTDTQRYLAYCQEKDRLSPLEALPYDVLQQILRHLEPKHLAAIAQTSRSMYIAATDNTLWRNLLKREMLIWPTVSFDTMPGHYAVEKMAKHTYMRCSPMVPARRQLRLLEQAQAVVTGSIVLRRLFTPPRMRIALFGPGLESVAENLVNDLMWLATSPFTLLGMLPGQDGIGGGVSLGVGNSFVIDLVTLYQKTAAERREHNDEDLGRFEEDLTPAAKAVCQSVDAFVFVVDSNKLAQEAGTSEGAPDDAGLIDTSKHLTRSVADAYSFLNPEWSDIACPLAVWSCTASSNPVSWSAVKVASQLRLPGLARPWTLHNVPVDNFSGPVIKTVTWLFEHTRKRK